MQLSTMALSKHAFTKGRAHTRPKLTSRPCIEWKYWDVILNYCLYMFKLTIPDRDTNGTDGHRSAPPRRTGRWRGKSSMAQPGMVQNRLIDSVWECKWSSSWHEIMRLTSKPLPYMRLSTVAEAARTKTAVGTISMKNTLAWPLFEIKKIIIVQNFHP